jgi:sialic acid synthase SpsE
MSSSIFEKIVDPKNLHISIIVEMPCKHKNSLEKAEELVNQYNKGASVEYCNYSSKKW